MNKENLKILINDLEIAINELRAEVYSDTESYLDKDNVRRVHTYDDDGDYE